MDSPVERGDKSGSVTPKAPKRQMSLKKSVQEKDTMNGPLYMQTSNNTVLVRRRRRHDEGPIKQFTRWFVENQIGLSVNLLALLLLAHVCIPRARDYTYKFVSLAYYNPSTNKYGLGKDDSYFILFCIVLFTGLRAGVMEYILAPFAKWRGISKKKDLVRFSEQAWLLTYYLVFWPLGLWLYMKSSYYLNLKNLWTDWPSREMEGVMKGYVLAQLSFWLQQILVINIEERRKDHYQMLSHHVITISLIYGCYRYYHTRVGNLVLVLMDIVDIFLPIAKCLKYLGYTTICDIAFGVFILSWFLARHVFYATVCYSIWKHTPEIMSFGCYRGAGADLTGPFDPPEGLGYLLEPFYDAGGLVCFDEKVKWSFLTALLFLQVITLAWFAIIINVAIRILKGGSEAADDPRSDEEAEEEYVYEEAEPLEEEVGIEEIDLKSWERRTGVKRQAQSSGVSLPGHSDRKELLGRIGCEKQVD